MEQKKKVVLLYVLRDCHTSAQNALKSKHGYKGELLLDTGKVKFLLDLFCTGHQTYAVKKNAK